MYFVTVTVIENPVTRVKPQSYLERSVCLVLKRCKPVTQHAAFLSLLLATPLFDQTARSFPRCRPTLTLQLMLRGMMNININ